MEMHMNETTSQLAITPVGEMLIHPDIVEAAKRRLATGPAIEDVARQFALMADPTRLRMLTALDAGELCVNDLSAATGINRSTVSHQLRVLRDARLVRTRREGKVVYYALDDDHVVSLMAMASAHLTEEEKSK
jgi:ArsR family transcriptional regulator, lead/cadmium/zinc/bismuth-responsive transcriptional repressor